MTSGLGIGILASGAQLRGKGLPALPAGYVFVMLAGAHLLFDGGYLIAEAR